MPATNTSFLDHNTITEALGLWCRIFDTKAFAEMRQVFADSIQWDFGKRTVDFGLNKVIGRIEAHLLRDSYCGATQHQLANLRIDVNGDAAESEA